MHVQWNTKLREECPLFRINSRPSTCQQFPLLQRCRFVSFKYSYPPPHPLPRNDRKNRLLLHVMSVKRNRADNVVIAGFIMAVETIDKRVITAEEEEAGEA